MNTKEKAPTNAATSAGAAGAETGKETISDFHCTSGGAGRQEGKILSLLMEGEENAIPASDLVMLAGFRNERSLRLAIDRERENSLILASDKGYFRPQPGDKGFAEIQAFVRRMDGRCASNRRVTKKARATLRELERKPLDGQTELWHGGGADG